jgi:hypothetical protein
MNLSEPESLLCSPGTELRALEVAFRRLPGSAKEAAKTVE